MEFIGILIAITISAIPGLILVFARYPDIIVQGMDIEPYQWPMYIRRVRTVAAIVSIVLIGFAILGQMYIRQEPFVATFVTLATILAVQVLFWLADRFL